MEAPYDPIPIRNDSGEEIPSFAVVEPTGEIRDGAKVVRKPTRNGRRGVLVNGPGAIPVGGAGDAYAHPRVRVLTAGEPPLYAEWGATAGAWHLSDVGGGGFIHTGGYEGGVSNFLRYGVTEAPDQSGSGGSGLGGGGSGCDLESVSFTVVTAVDLNACTVETKTITITGCNLSITVPE